MLVIYNEACEVITKGRVNRLTRFRINPAGPISILTELMRLDDDIILELHSLGYDPIRRPLDD